MSTLVFPTTLTRPRPPLSMAEAFEPAVDVWPWVQRAFLDDTSPLYNDEHDHLAHANVGVLWTHVENIKQQRLIVGTAEVPDQRGSKWQKARAEMQLRQWFGLEELDFLITLSAPYAAEVDDASFCALIEHEMLHCAQDLDAFGAPKFNRRTGRPIYAIRGHDAEEFVSVVRRYGLGSAAGGVRQLVEAAAKAPEIAAASIASVCGTCMARAA